jgi:hypothetical protein
MNHQQVLVPMWRRSTNMAHRIVLYVFSYNPGISTRTSHEEMPRVATFYFPELVDGVEALRLEGAGNPYTSREPPADVAVPFYCDMGLRLFTLNIFLSPMRDARPVGFYLFAPSNAIEQFCRGLGHRDVPWEQWADKVRLIYKVPLGLISDGHLFQTRCLLPALEPVEVFDDLPPTLDAITPFVIFDFSPALALRRDFQAETFTNCEYVFDENTVEHASVWKESPVTGAACPYRKIRTNVQMPLRTSMFSIMEDCLVFGDERG